MIALGLVEFQEVHIGLSLNSVQVPLDDVPSHQRVNHTTQLCAIGKPAEGALNPTVYHFTKLNTWKRKLK